MSSSIKERVQVSILDRIRRKRGLALLIVLCGYGVLACITCITVLRVYNYLQ